MNPAIFVITSLILALIFFILMQLKLHEVYKEIFPDEPYRHWSAKLKYMFANYTPRFALPRLYFFAFIICYIIGMYLLVMGK